MQIPEGVKEEFEELQEKRIEELYNIRYGAEEEAAAESEEEEILVVDLAREDDDMVGEVCVAGPSGVATKSDPRPSPAATESDPRACDDDSVDEDAETE